jgi:hypothetical protein
MATAILLPAPELQFCDANGLPYSGGTIETYLPGTTTPKQTWVDPGEAALNTNPIILDAAGRCIIYGSGDYRLILRDAAGNLIYDQLSSTVVSDAMQPVVSAPTINDAKILLGISGFATASDHAAAISAEQNARSAADTAETNARIAADTAETNARTAADANLQTQITALSAGGTAMKVQGGTTGVSGGHARITFGTAFTSVVSCVASIQGSAFTAVCIEVQADNTGADIYVSQTNNNPATAPVYWIAIGT